MSPEREIENLIYRYAELIDDGEMEAVATLLARAKFIGPDGQVQGAGSAEIGALYRSFTRLFPDGTPLSHHVTSNVSIEVSGQKARSRSYFTVFQATDQLALQPIMAGRYVDTFVCDTQGWYFSSRQIIPRLAGDLSQHLLSEY